jgi:CBS domain containing-hemolysin-like protein
MEELGHVPEPGERLEIDGVEVEVEAISGHAVQAILALPSGGRRTGNGGGEAADG